MRNNYEGTLEDWKVELIRRRARRLKVPSSMLADTEQELDMTLLDLNYVDGHKDGATEQTFLTEVIDRRIRSLLRKDRRYRKRVTEESRKGLPEHTDFDMRLREAELVADVHSALTRLDRSDRLICELLAEGKSLAVIARELDLNRDTVQRRIDSIRQQLRTLGLDEWTRNTEANRVGSAELISARDAARLCGRSERAWRTWDAAGLIPQPVRIGRSTMWRRTELQAWIKAGCPRREDWELVSQSKA